MNSAVLPPEMHEITLNCRYIWRAPFKVPDKIKKYGSLTLTYASQLHIAVVEIDRDTYIPRILDYVAIDDCGTVINPPIVEGQVYGVGALDPVVMGSVIATLAIIAAIACSVPARRATRVDPVIVLNS